MRRRTKSRVWALQILYAHEITEKSIYFTSRLFFKDREVSREKKAYTRRLLDCYEERQEEVDDLIEKSVANWRMDRLSIIDKNILRISICELLFLSDIPGKASINEAVNLSHLFGGEDSPGFVNGVLDAILHQASETK